MIFRLNSFIPLCLLISLTILLFSTSASAQPTVLLPRRTTIKPNSTTASTPYPYKHVTRAQLVERYKERATKTKRQSKPSCLVGVDVPTKGGVVGGLTGGLTGGKNVQACL